MGTMPTFYLNTGLSEAATDDGMQRTAEKRAVRCSQAKKHFPFLTLWATLLKILQHGLSHGGDQWEK